MKLIVSIYNIINSIYRRSMSAWRPADGDGDAGDLFSWSLFWHESRLNVIAELTHTTKINVLRTYTHPHTHTPRWHQKLELQQTESFLRTSRLTATGLRAGHPSRQQVVCYCHGNQPVAGGSPPPFLWATHHNWWKSRLPDIFIKGVPQLKPTLSPRFSFLTCVANLEAFWSLLNSSFSSVICSLQSFNNATDETIDCENVLKVICGIDKMQPNALNRLKKINRT